MKVMKLIDSLGEDLQIEWWALTGIRPWGPRAMVAAAICASSIGPVLMALGIYSQVLSVLLLLLAVSALVEVFSSVRRWRRRRFEASWPAAERIPSEKDELR